MALLIFPFNVNSMGFVNVTIPANSACHSRLRIKPPKGRKFLIKDPSGNTYQDTFDSEFTFMRTEGQGRFLPFDVPFSVQLDSGSGTGTGFLD